jgi:hypothetical protein
MRCCPKSGRIGLLAHAGLLGLTMLPARLAADPPELSVPAADGGSLRALALGGAFVGVADDAGSVGVNPAGLMMVPRSFDVVAAPWGTTDGRPRHAAFALHPSRWWAVGGGWQQSASQAILGADGSSQLDGFDGTSFLGAAFAFPDRRFAGGASGEWRRLSYVDGSTAGHDTAFSWTAGVTFRPDNREAPRIGLRYSAQSEWTLADGRHAMRPPVASAGTSWHYRVLRISDILLSLQSDWVRYSKLTSEAQGAFRARDDLDLRMGLEASFPFECFTGCGTMIQLRAGLHNAAPRPFDLRRPRTPDAVGQGPARETRWAVGAALALGSVLQGRLKAEVTYERSARAFGIGVGWRFPEAYRAEIEDQTRR